MSGFNGILGYAPTSSLEDVQDAIGITQFQENSWYQTIGGLQLQGGITAEIATSTSTVIEFPAPYETQLLGVFLQPIDHSNSSVHVESAGTTLEQFTIHHSGTSRKFYWVALGV